MNTLGSVRRRLLASIHCAKRDAGLDEETYRVLLMREAGKESAAHMTQAELVRVQKALRPAGNAGRGKRRPSQHRHVRKVYALWWRLAEASIVKPGHYSCDRFVLRQTGIASTEWLDPEQAFRVIEALKSIACRHQISLAAPKRRSRRHG